MSTASVANGPETSGWTSPNEDVAELVLLLPGWQARALEEAAQQRGLTGGQLTRRLIRLFLEHNSKASPSQQ